jgi:hypothetical protein
MPSVLCVWIVYVGDVGTTHVVSTLTAVEFVTNMNEKGRVPSPPAIQVKNR